MTIPGLNLDVRLEHKSLIEDALNRGCPGMWKERMSACAWFCERRALQKATDMGEYTFYIQRAVKSVHFRRGSSVAALDKSFFQDLGQKVPIGSCYNFWIVEPTKKNVLTVIIVNRRIWRSKLRVSTRLANVKAIKIASEGDNRGISSELAQDYAWRSERKASYMASDIVEYMYLINLAKEAAVFGASK